MHSHYRIPQLCIAFFLIVTVMTAQEQQKWTLKNDKDNVKVYYKATTDVHDVKLTTSIKTSMSGIIHLLSEVDKYPRWGYKVVEARILKRVSNTEMYYYSKLDFPWPMNDRDIIMHSKLEQDPVTHKIVAISTAVPDYLAETKDVVRIRTCNTSWTFAPGTGGWIYVEYYIHSNPGGNIPSWLVNAAIDVGPRETINSIRTFLSKPEYQQVKLAYIKE